MRIQTVQTRTLNNEIVETPISALSKAEKRMLGISRSRKVQEIERDVMSDLTRMFSV